MFVNGVSVALIYLGLMIEIRASKLAEKRMCAR